MNGKDGRVIWSDTYERPIFPAPQEIAGLIARAVREQLALRRTKLFRARDVNPAAYSLYRRARYGPRLTADSIPYFQQAIANEPHFAPAQDGLAGAYLELARSVEDSPRELMAKAEQAALAAIAIDEDLAEGHLDLGIAKATYKWDWAGAERGFRRALELNPNVDGGRPSYGLDLAAMGRFDAAMDQAPDTEPTPLGAAITYASIFYFSRQYQRTIEYCCWILEFAPAAAATQFWLGRAYADQGRLNEAIELIERSRDADKRRRKGFGILSSLYVKSAALTHSHYWTRR